MHFLNRDVHKMFIKVPIYIRCYECVYNYKWLIINMLGLFSPSGTAFVLVIKDFKMAVQKTTTGFIGDLRCVN